MGTTQSLTIKLGLDGLAQVTAGFKALNTVASSTLGAITNVAAPLAALAAAATGIAGITAGFSAVLHEGGKLNDLSQRTGVAAEGLVRLRQIFVESGKSADDVGQAFDKTAKAIFEAATQGGPAEGAFNRLGLSAATLAQLAPEEQFDTLAQRIAQLPSPTERSAVAMQLFGRSGAELLPVFESFKDLTQTDAALGRLPQVLGRNVAVLDSIGDAFTQVRLKALQVFAGVFDQVGPKVDELVKTITRIDLTGFGQSLGGMVNVAIDAWNAGNFPEFIGLTVEAGWDLGMTAARRLWQEFVAFAGPVFWNSLAVGLAELIAGVGKAVVSAFSYVLQIGISVMAYLGDHLRFAFESTGQVLRSAFGSAVDFLAERLEGVVNVAVRKLNELLHTSLAEVSLGRVGPGDRDTVRRPFTWDESVEIASEGRKDFLATIHGIIDEGPKALRELIAIDGSVFGQGTAWERLKAMIAGARAARETDAAAHAQSNRATGQQVQFINALKAALDAEAEAKRKLAVLDERLALIEGDFGKTDAQKWAAKRAILTEELGLKQALLDRDNELLRTPGLTNDERDKVQTRIDQNQRGLGDTRGKLAGQGADPNSVAQQMESAITGLQNQFGTVAQGIARSFTSVIGTAVDSVSGGLQKLIGDTEYWSSKLGKIAGPIMGAVTASITRMFTEWIVQRGLAAVKNMIFSGQEGAADATAKAPGAILTSISSYGVAAAVGVAAVIAALAAFGGFESGGYTGNGPTGQIAGAVHGREYVFDASSVARIGVPTLEAFRAGELQPVAAGAAGPATGKPQRTVIVSDERRLQDMENDPAFETVVVRLMERNRWRYKPA